MYTQTFFALYVSPPKASERAERKSSLVRMRRKSPSLLIKDVLGCYMEMRKTGEKKKMQNPPILSYSPSLHLERRFTNILKRYLFLFVIQG